MAASCQCLVVAFYFNCVCLCVVVCVCGCVVSVCINSFTARWQSAGAPIWCDSDMVMLYSFIFNDPPPPRLTRLNNSDMAVRGKRGTNAPIRPREERLCWGRTLHLTCFSDLVGAGGITCSHTHTHTKTHTSTHTNT